MYYKDYPAIKSPELQAVIVEQILVVCVNRTRFNELFDTIRRITSFSHYTLKKYLFHLIEYGIISYKGENQVYVITRTGLELLSIINRERKTTQLDFKDIVICLEISKYITLLSTSSVTIICKHCKTNLAEIFQESGDYCLNCWQEITCPNV